MNVLLKGQFNHSYKYNDTDTYNQTLLFYLDLPCNKDIFIGNNHFKIPHIPEAEQMLSFEIPSI